MSPLAVFFPSLMGVGILVSGALLVADLLRKYVPQGDLRRRHGVALATYQIVQRAATWADGDVSPGDLLERAPRRSMTYAAWAIGAITIGVAIPISAAAAYRDDLGVFYASPWMVGLGIAGAAAGALAAVVLLGLCFRRVRSRRAVGWIVAHTVLGRLQVPELSYSSVEIGQIGDGP